MTQWWQKHNGALDRSACDNVISRCLEIPAQTATVGHGGTQRVDAVIRTTKVRFLRRNDPQFQSLFGVIANNGAMTNMNCFGFDILGFNEIQFLEYNDNSAHYDWHEDLDWKPNPDKYGPCQRKLSMVLLLSDPSTYTGGRLRLAHDDFADNAQMARGDMVFFPSFLRHKVEPVTAGVRYVLTAWFTGPRFR